MNTKCLSFYLDLLYLSSTIFCGFHCTSLIPLLINLFLGILFFDVFKNKNVSLIFIFGMVTLVCRNTIGFLKRNFYFGITSNLQKSCKGSTESYHILLTQFFLPLTSYITMAHLKKLRNPHYYITIN